MRRAEIREAVDEALCEKGYSLGWRYWNGPELRIAGVNGQAMFAARFPSGISRKRLKAALAALPAAGAPRKYQRSDYRAPMQLEAFA